MKQKFRQALFLLSGLAAFSSCHHVSTTAERKASFAPYADVKIHDEWIDRSIGISGYMKLRTGVLFSSAGTDTRAGLAAAVDNRGYYLTAAHCVDEGEFMLYVAHRLPAQPSAADTLTVMATKTEVVWRGDVRKGEPDLALLFCSRPPSAVFEWATEPKINERAVAVGPNYENKTIDFSDYSLGEAAGELFRVDAKSSSALNWTQLVSGVPLHGGDSGGPLANSAGRLLGINHAVSAPKIWATLSPPGIWRAQFGLTVRPDLAWLRRVIDEDYATRPKAPAIAAFWRRSDSAEFLARALRDALRELEAARLLSGAPEDNRARYHRQELVRKTLADTAGLTDPAFDPVIKALPQIDSSAPTSTADFEQLSAFLREQFQMN